MAHLTETPDTRTWDLTGYRVTQLHIDAESVRIEVWTLAAAFEIRLGVPFRLLSSDGATTILDPEQSSELAPMLQLIGGSLSALCVRRSGNLVLTFADGRRLEADSHPAYEAWEVRGAGALEAIGYLASPGGGSPWG